MPDYHLVFAALGAILFFAPITLYISEMLRGDIKPNVVSWGGWTLIMTIAASAQIAEGASWSVVIPIASVFADGTVFVLAFKYGTRTFSPLDKMCIALGVTAIIAWVITKEPMLAIVLSLVADAIVAAPTIRKTWLRPHSEAALPWLLFAVGALFGAISTTQYDVANLAFPIYFIVLSSLIGGLALRKSGGTFRR